MVDGGGGGGVGGVGDFFAALGRFLPQLFEVVVAADRGQHDVHDDIAGIDQHPFPGVFAFHADNVAARFFHLVMDAARQGAGLPV